MTWRLEENWREVCKRCLRWTGHPGKRVNRLMQWRQDCVAKNVRDGNGHRVSREQGGLKCKDCGRFGRNLKQVKCGSAHRGKIAKALSPTGIKDFWSKFPNQGKTPLKVAGDRRGGEGLEGCFLPKGGFSLLKANYPQGEKLSEEEGV